MGNKCSVSSKDYDKNHFMKQQERSKVSNIFPCIQKPLFYNKLSTVVKKFIFSRSLFLYLIYCVVLTINNNKFQYNLIINQNAKKQSLNLQEKDLKSPDRFKKVASHSHKNTCKLSIHKKH